MALMVDTTASGSPLTALSLPCTNSMPVSPTTAWPPLWLAVPLSVGTVIWAAVCPPGVAAEEFPVPDAYEDPPVT